MAGKEKYTPEFFLEREEFWLDSEREAFELRIQGLTWPQIAERVGTSHTKLCNKAQNLETRAIKRGFSPGHDMVKTVPDGFQVRGVSTMYDHEGKQRAQWVKSQTDHERQKEIMVERLERASELKRKPFKPTKGPAKTADNLLNLFVFSDFHVGGLAYPPEVFDEPWDTDIAADVFLNALSDMLSCTMKSDTAVFCNLGDFLHFDGIEPKTSNPATNHILDTDTRYSRLIDITLRIVDEAIHILLKHHKKVIVLHAEGNHDEVGSIWLRKHCAAVWRNEPRVEVLDVDNPYYAIPWGDYLLGFHHSHLKKMENLAQTFASIPAYRKMWGLAKMAYIHTGHMHHRKMLEGGGAIVRQHSTLSSTDSYAARLGLHSESSASVIVYDKQDGEIAEFKVRPRIS